MPRMTATAVKRELAEVLRRVSQDRDQVTITHRGRPVATLVPIDEAERPNGRAAEPGEPVRTGEANERTAAALRESEERYRWLVEMSPSGIMVNVNGRIAYANPSAMRVFGALTDDALIGRSIMDVIHPLFHEVVARRTKSALEDGLASAPMEQVYVALDGRSFDVETTATPITYQGETAVLMVFRHITEQKQIREELARSEERLRQATQLAGLGHWVWDAIEDNCVYCSDEHARLHGLSAAEYIARSAKLDAEFTLTHPEDRDEVKAAFAALRAGTGFEMEYRVVTPEGEARYVREIAKPIFGDDGKVYGEYGISQDITKRRLAEAALRESEARLQAFIDNLPAEIAIKDSTGHYVVVNRTFTERYDLAGRDLRSLTAHDIFPGPIADFIVAQDDAVLREGRPFEQEVQANMDGDDRTFLVLRFPIPDSVDGTSAIGAIATDITWRTRAEEALRQSDERFRAVVENSPNAIAMKDLDGRFQLVNGRFREWLGIGDIDLSDKTAYDVHEAEQADALTAQDRDVLARLAVVEREHSIRFADGKYHTIVTTKFPVLDDARQPIGVGSIGMDVTEQRAAEERLRQAMKMEAVGQLTGGVAHDFNNLLGTIMGNAELLEDRVGKADRQVHAILRAADLGAELTQRLLAFSRRQVLSPQPLALDKLVDDTCELLARTLGDNIEVGVRAQDGLWPAMVDPGQVENALLNLAINARDAMADGGRLSIDMDNRSIDDHDAAVMGLGPGDYVVLTVRDTGCGIAPSVLEQVFDPFFTTKDVGQGSGLGLSMVYGFAQQSGGHISIESEPGRGTTVRLLLPRATAVPASTEHADAADDADGRGETILILEDDHALRELAVAILRGLGYRVISAHNGDVARAILTQGGSVDLLLADVMLPGGLSGPALAEQAKILRPDIKILFMSGHAADALVKEGKLGNGVPIVQKPFRKAELARRVREALQEPAVDLQAVAAAR